MISTILTKPMQLVHCLKFLPYFNMLRAGSSQEQAEYFEITLRFVRCFIMLFRNVFGSI